MGGYKYFVFTFLKISDRMKKTILGDVEMDLTGKKILFLGDSITEGVGTSLPECRFSDLIAKNEGTVCFNYGIGGTRIAYQQTPSENARWDLNFIDRVDEMEDTADIIFVFGGTNDYGHGDAAIGEFSDRTPNTFYGAVHTLFVKLIEKYPESKIVFATPLHRLGEKITSLKGGVVQEVTLNQYVGILREVAEYYSIPVLDLFKCGGLQPSVPVLKQKYMPDGLHPNDAGHVILADRISAFFKNFFN